MLEIKKKFEKDFNVDSLLKNIIIFEEFPVIDDIVLTFRGYCRIHPFIQYLLSPNRDTEDATHKFLSEHGMPGDFLDRVIVNSKDKEITVLAKTNRNLLNLWEGDEE